MHMAMKPTVCVAMEKSVSLDKLAMLHCFRMVVHVARHCRFLWVVRLGFRVRTMVLFHCVCLRVWVWANRAMT
jgi:hypothetical protein